MTSLHRSVVVSVGLLSLVSVAAAFWSSDVSLAIVAISIPWVVLAARRYGPVRLATWGGFTALLLQGTTLPAATSLTLTSLGVPLTLPDFVAMSAGVILVGAQIDRKLLRFKTVLVGLGVGVILLGVTGGLLGNNPSDALLRETLLQARFIAAALIVLYALRASPERASTMLVVSLWLSAGMLVANALVGLPLEGTTAVVNSLVGVVSAASDTGIARYQVAGSMTALFYLCAVLAGTTCGIRLSTALRLAVLPALATTILGFSRHSVLALGVAGAVALGFTLRARTLSGVFRVARASAGGVIIWVLLVTGFPESGAGRMLSETGRAFTERVVVGFTASGRDSSLQLREIERSYAVSAISAAPLAGHGYGAQYRPALPYGSGDFWRDYGRTYIHDSTLWILIKTGIAGLVACAAIVIVAVRGLRPRRDAASAAAIACLVAALVIGRWVPMLLDPRGGVPILGAIVAACALLGSRSRPSGTHGVPLSGARKVAGRHGFPDPIQLASRRLLPFR